MPAVSDTRKPCPRDCASYPSYVTCFVAGMAALNALELFLAFRTPESRAAVLCKPLDDAAAFRGLAFLAFTIVNLKRVLEITKFAGGLAMVAQRRAAGLDGLVEHRVNCRHQPPGVIGGFSLLRRQRRSQPSRRQMRTI